VTVADYDQLELSERAPKRVVDHSATWATLEPIASVNGQTEQRIRAFCESKRITVAALAALGTRFAIRRGGKLELAFAGDSGAGAITAIKYRDVGGDSRNSYTETPSSWLRPIVTARRDSLNWVLCEGETDGARLVELIGDEAAIMVLPAGALTFRREWAARIPRGATVALAHDADNYGDEGAERAAKIIGGRTVRLRPPIEGGDWCDWDGSRDELRDLIVDATTASPAVIVSAEEFASVDEPGAEALLGEGQDDAVLPAGGDGMIYGDGGAGKSTLAIDGGFHLASGTDFLGITVQRPVNVLLLDSSVPKLLSAFSRVSARPFSGPPVAAIRSRHFIRVLSSPPCAPCRSPRSASRTFRRGRTARPRRPSLLHNLRAPQPPRAPPESRSHVAIRAWIGLSPPTGRRTAPRLSRRHNRVKRQRGASSRCLPDDRLPLHDGGGLSAALVTRSEAGSMLWYSGPPAEPDLVAARDRSRRSRLLLGHSLCYCRAPAEPVFVDGDDRPRGAGADGDDEGQSRDRERYTGLGGGLHDVCLPSKSAGLWRALDAMGERPGGRSPSLQMLCRARDSRFRARHRALPISRLRVAAPTVSTAPTAGTYMPTRGNSVLAAEAESRRPRTEPLT
jgi:hypothetical protein